MTDHMDDLRQASAEVSGIEILSPACVAVKAAYYERLKAVSADCATEDQALAAALRAAADQVVPDYCLEHQLNDSEWQTGFTDANCRVRANLLAIAAELEGTNG